MRRPSPTLLALVLLFSVVPFASAATWVEVEVTCPVCGTLNIFKVPASYGTYIYYEPSRFQYVFWPSTTDKFLHTCRRCHLTAYMHDFEKIPQDSVPALEEMLESEGRIEGEVVPYDAIPMTVRLPIAKKVYELLGRDEEFWSEFHRIEGFHFAEAGLSAEAKKARQEALSLTESLLERDTPGRKELLVIAAAMRFHTGDISGAKASLAAAETLTFRSNELGPEQSDGLDRYLSELIHAFREKLLQDEPLD